MKTYKTCAVYSKDCFADSILRIYGVVHAAHRKDAIDKVHNDMNETRTIVHADGVYTLRNIELTVQDAQ